MKNIFKNNHIEIILLFIIVLGNVNLFGNDLERIVKLNTRWKFSIGDFQKWASPIFNDKAGKQ